MIIYETRRDREAVLHGLHPGTKARVYDAKTRTDRSCGEQTEWISMNGCDLAGQPSDGTMWLNTTTWRIDHYSVIAAAGDYVEVLFP